MSYENIDQIPFLMALEQWIRAIRENREKQSEINNIEKNSSEFFSEL